MGSQTTAWLIILTEADTQCIDTPFTPGLPLDPKLKPRTLGAFACLQPRSQPSNFISEAQTHKSYIMETVS